MRIFDIISDTGSPVSELDVTVWSNLGWQWCGLVGTSHSSSKLSKRIWSWSEFCQILTRCFHTSQMSPSPEFTFGFVWYVVTKDGHCFLLLNLMISLKTRFPCFPGDHCSVTLPKGPFTVVLHQFVLLNRTSLTSIRDVPNFSVPQEVTGRYFPSPPIPSVDWY